MKITSSRFERSAAQPQDEPRSPGPDLVFVGRSNVGKSSLINRLLGVKGLARTSSRPGRTQSINFFRVNEWCYFVDLPGYGYAKVPRAIRESWKPMVEGFLNRRRERIALAVVVVDARRPTTGLDSVMREWLEHEEIPHVVVATKSDKLSASERARLARAETPASGRRPVLVSVTTGLGISELWKQIDSAFEAYRNRV